MTTATGPVPPLGLPDRIIDVSLDRAVDRRVWLATAAMAAATDLVLRRGPGLSAALLVAVVTAGLLASGRVVNRAAWFLAGVAPVFGLFLAVRMSPPLVALNGAAALGLLALAASLARGGDPFDLTVPDLARRAAVALAHGAAAPVFLLGGGGAGDGAGQRRAADDTRVWPALARGLALALPVVLVLGLLLGAGDAVFASWFDLRVNADNLLLHAILFGIGAWAGGGLLRVASAVAPAPLRAAGPRLGFVEAATVLGALVALYAAFAAAQLVALAGGSRHVLETTGLTYAEYARSGFFQLLAAAALTLAVLLAVRAGVDLSDPTRRRRFVVLAEVAVGLTLLIVVVAVRRLHLYEQAYGLTLARLFATVFALWVGAVFFLLALSLAGVHRRRRWLVPAALAAGLVAVLALDVVGPERLVVVRSVDNYERTGRLDAGYLVNLSDDAVPALVDALPRLDAVTRADLRTRLCRTDPRDQPRRGALSWSWSSHQADAARNDVCR